MKPRRSVDGQRGSLAVAYVLLLALVVGFIGMGVTLGMVYARRTELKNAASAAALAAAAALDGTSAGVTAAVAKAQAALAQTYYRFGLAYSWSDEAISFATQYDATDDAWLSASAATAAPADIAFARIDTSKLPDSPGQVALLFLRVPDADSVTATARAVAGPALTHIDPIAICAMSTTAAAARANALGAGNEELVEYGFRRGVSYNLLDLNPGGAAPVNYVINPVDFPPAANYASHVASNVVKPFACSGRIPAPAQLQSLYVSSPFPAAALADALNVRLQLDAPGNCNATVALPDRNVREFVAGYTGFWMGTAPLAAYAQPVVSGGARKTIADLATPPAGATASWWGTLWGYVRPVRYSATAADHAGAQFGKGDWSALYPTAPAPGTSYSDANPRPYFSTGVNLKNATGNIERYRRVLHVPLLSCPVPASGQATVLAVAKFLLTTRASASAIPAEFGGVVSVPAVRTSFMLYQ
ncbi:MAG: pilus assembly protein TadG-related protein [Telluria sp.]